MENDFKVILPAYLEKSKDGEWRVSGLASTESLDLQNEKILQKGIDLSPIDQGKGFFNWDHDNSPESIIGEIDGYRRDPQGLFIHGKLFKNHSKAKAVREIMESLSERKKGAMGLSVEGQVLERDPNNPAIIKKCRIKNVALTLNPVNPNTYAQLLKSLTPESEVNFNLERENVEAVLKDKEENSESPVFTASQVLGLVEKALAFSGNVTAPVDKVQGDALAKEDLKEEKKEEKKPKKLKKMQACLYKSELKGLLKTLSVLYPSYSKEVLWETLKERLETKFPEISDFT